MRFLIIISLILTSCERYITEIKDVTLSGKYVISKLEISNENQKNDSIYLIGSTYTNKSLSDPFDTIVLNNFHLHFDYSTVRIKIDGINSFGQEIWRYGNSSDLIFYRHFGRTAFTNGYIQFQYRTNQGSITRMFFIIEHDGIESLQLKTSGSWFTGENGQRQTMTLFLTRIGP